MTIARKRSTHHSCDDEPVEDEDNPEWTENDFKRARPASELPKEVLAAFPKMRGRPPKPPGERKVAISIRLHPRVLAHYKAAGRGWQTHMEEILVKARSKGGAPATSGPRHRSWRPEDALIANLQEAHRTVPTG